MAVRMIGYGMLAGASVLLALAVLQWLAAQENSRLIAAGAAEGDISDQVWQVLAEARRITAEGSI